MPSPEPAGTAPLASFFRDFPQRRYIMFGGKGGLGKTTFSAATAYYLARRGYKVLVFSVDPQASLSDIFQRDIYGRGPVEIIPGLFAQEIDADRHIKEYQDQIRRKILEMYGFDRVPDEIEHYIAAASAEPAMEESAIFDQVVDIVVAGQYDYFIYDLVPLGHALYYLSMASVYDEWIERITRLREEMQQYAEMAARFKGEQLQEDLILQELQDIRQRITTSSRILTDQARTAFFFVIVPEEMVLLDTQKAAQLFSRFQVPISGYIVNRVLPEALAQEEIPDYLRHRLQMQQGYLRKISELFGGQVLAWIPEFERDVTGLEMIARMADAMFDGDGRERADG